MGIKRLIAVSDTGPLIHLIEIGAANLISIFDEIHIPGAVFSELHKHNQDYCKNIMNFNHIKQHIVPKKELDTFITHHNLDKLHSGERECLYLCQKKNFNILLTDDLAVRKTAQTMQLKPIGSLGLVVKACHANLISISEAELFLLSLYNISSLYATKAIVDIAIEQLKEKNLITGNNKNK